MRLFSIFILFITFAIARALQQPEFPDFLKDKELLTESEMLKISNECWHTLSEGYDAKVFVQCYKKEQKFDLAALKSLSLVFKYGKYKDVFYLLIVPWGEAIPASMMPQRKKLSETASADIIKAFNGHVKEDESPVTCPYNGKQVQIILQRNITIFRNMVFESNGDDLIGWTTEGEKNYVVKSIQQLASPSEQPASPSKQPAVPVLGAGLEYVTYLYGQDGINYLTAYGGVWDLWKITKATAGLKFINPFGDTGKLGLSVEFAVKGAPGKYEAREPLDRIVALSSASGDSETDSIFGYFQRKDQVIRIFRDKQTNGVYISRLTPRDQKRVMNGEDPQAIRREKRRRKAKNAKGPKTEGGR